MTTMDIGPIETSPWSPDADRARREREAREALDRRLSERQAMRGYVPQRGPLLDEYGMPAEGALPPDAVVAPRPPGSPVAPLPEMPPLDVSPDAPNVGLGQAVMTSPPPTAPAVPQGQPTPTPSAPHTPPAPGQLASTTPPNPAPVADASTDPNTPTVTAGAQAAQLAQGQPQPIGGAMGAAQLAAPPMRAPGADSGPRFAMGATGLGAPDQPVADRAAGLPSAYEQRLATAQGEDDRRDRIRRLLQGLAVLMGAATAKGGGGGAIPLGIAAGMVRPSNQADRVRATDEREQALGTERARQQAVLDQLQQRRDAQSATERNQQQQLALRLAELQGTQQDRAMRTGIALRENEREEDLLDPASAVSGRTRTQFREWLRTSPREIQQAVNGATLDGLAANELLTLQRELSGNYNSRNIGGGRGGSTGVSGSAGRPLASVDAAPESYVRAVRQASPGMTEQEARDAADIQWARLDEERQANWLASPDAQRLANTLGRSIEGYEQVVDGAAISDEDYRAAAATNADARAIESDVTAAIDALNEIAQLPASEQLGVRAADAFGAEVHSAVSTYNNARSSIMGTLARMRATGVINEAEYQRFVTDMPDVSSPRQALSGTRRLQAVLDGVRRLERIHMAQRGFRRRGDGGPEQRPEERPTGGVLFIWRTSDGQTRRTTAPPDQVARARSRIGELGGTVVREVAQ